MQLICGPCKERRQGTFSDPRGSTDDLCIGRMTNLDSRGSAFTAVIQRLYDLFVGGMHAQSRRAGRYSQGQPESCSRSEMLCSDRNLRLRLERAFVAVRFAQQKMQTNSIAVPFTDASSARFRRPGRTPRAVGLAHNGQLNRADLLSLQWF